MLAFDILVDCADEYLKIGASTTLECMKKFALDVMEVFEDDYMRKPNQADVDRLLQFAEAPNFCGILASIDCMQWEWKNCPTGWKV